MALSFSRHHISKLGAHAAHLQRRLEGASRKTEHVLGRVISTGLTVGTSAILGGVHGRFGKIAVVGVPIELGLGTLGFIGSLAGLGGHQAKHLGDVANGLLSPYAYTTLRGVGANLKAKTADATAATVKGPLPGRSLDPSEVAAIRQPIEAQR